MSRRGRRADVTFKLLLFLNPDATDIRHIARYLYANERPPTILKTYALISSLKKKGWVISKYDYRLDVTQYHAFQLAYARQGYRLKHASLESRVVLGIASR